MFVSLKSSLIRNWSFSIGCTIRKFKKSTKWSKCVRGCLSCLTAWSRPPNSRRRFWRISVSYWKINENTFHAMIHETVILSRNLFSMTGSYSCLHGEVMEKRTELFKSISYRIHFTKVYRIGWDLHGKWEVFSFVAMGFELMRIVLNNGGFGIKINRCFIFRESR